ncbi:hypothetical protein HFD88_008984 [Aspergillus terreus]|uniref:O-methyltransferase pgmB n=1 Tax=Aspergillus terreus TaxID=33178 RepID=PGMB_ASPTE|nr:RecName: Full=O-methyltransferase pgmB; AltName: Full=Pigmented naphthoquinones biosynthesis cluster protein B [Aspergillus terreus]ARB51364.1 putative O-methyltransferase [Aspergillus terreus]KAG2417765.1 hypothetical protein HFD88_008984 [Aspergillus terreus]
MTPYSSAADLGSTVSPLEGLSSVITKNTSIVSQYLQANNLPQPSPEANGPVVVLPSDAPQDVQQARQQLIAASLEIFQLAIGPSEFLPHLATNFQYISCLTWLAHYDIFHLVPRDKNISYADLARATGVPEQRLKSILRMAMTSSLFREHPNGTDVGHSAVSALLASDDDAYSYATYMCSKTAPMAMSMTEAHKRWGASTRTNETAYNVAFNTELPLFDDLAQNKARMGEFARYMRSVRSSETVALKHLVSGVDWESIPAGGMLVDVGGSTGGAAIALAQAYPHIRFTIQDLPENVETGEKAAAASLPADIASRLTFQAHDFTLPQPVRAADAYLLRMILHDWPDEQAVKILRNIVTAMEETKSRLFIMDTVLPKPGSVPVSVERIARARDLTMIQSFNSKERELDEWKELITAADPRLQLIAVTQPLGSAMSILEIQLSAK